MERNVVFHNRFVTPEEMVQFVGSADIYITPYLHEAQAVSGTLAYAVGAGKAIISTPYWHATELLAEGRGALVPFGDSAAIGNKVGELLDDEAARHAMRKRAYLYGRDMVWKKVAQSYMRSFVRARTDRRQSPRAVYSGRVMERTLDTLPAINLEHLERMTDHTGLLQHAVFSVPNYHEGYATDDNARALIASVMLEQLGAASVSETARLSSTIYRILVACIQCFSRPLQEFSELRACLAGGHRIGRQPRTFSVGSRHSARTIEGFGAQRNRRTSLRIFSARGTELS